MTNHPGAHGGEHFVALCGVEKFGFFQSMVAAALIAVLVVVLAAVVIGDKRFVAGFFVSGDGEAFLIVHHQ